MALDLIRYDLLVQNALKGVVRNVLTEAARDGLPGDHHFCITFRTNAPGVKLSARIRERYPDELTIILQHQFWDLEVAEHFFEVGLSFGRIPERLTVPFDAISGFWDPSVQFGLKFEIQDETRQEGANDGAPNEISLMSAAPQTAPAPAPEIDTVRPESDGKSAFEAKLDEKPRKKEEPEPSPSENKVVSIDAFRKKT